MPRSNELLQNRQQQRAFIVSPHQDDAVLSLGNMLTQYGQVDIANIFTQSNSHILPHILNNVEQVSEIRRKEDAMVSGTYGFHFTDAGLDDSEVRGISWDNAWADIEPTITKQASDFIGDTVKVDKATDIYIPAAFGLHPDHLISHMASIEIIKKIGATSIYLFADQPYYNEPQFVRMVLHDRLTHTNRIELPFDTSAKQAMLELYPSQLSRDRIQEISHIGAEYIWPYKEEKRDLDRYAKQSGIFVQAPWIDLATSYRNNNGYDVLKPNEGSKDSPSTSMSFFKEQHIVNGVDTQMIRPTTVGYFDYFDLPIVNKPYSNESMSRIIQNVSSEGDVLWISGIREDSPLYSILVNRSAEQQSSIIIGNSSYMAECHPNGFESWIDSKTPKKRGKIRRIQRKQEMLENEHNQKVDIIQANSDILDNFLIVQKDRARKSGGAIDAFQDNEEYSEILENMATDGLLKAVVIHGNDTESSAGIMLFNEDPTNQTISIINQSFDPKFSNYYVGFIMQLELIQYAHSRGIVLVDYLRGDEPYKLDFANRKIQTFKYIEDLSGLANKNWEGIIEYVRQYEE